MVLQKNPTTNSTFCSKVWNWKQDNVFFVQQCVAGKGSQETFHCTAEETEAQQQREAADSGEHRIQSNLESFKSFTNLLKNTKELQGVLGETARRMAKLSHFCVFRQKTSPKDFHLGFLLLE